MNKRLEELLKKEKLTLEELEELEEMEEVKKIENCGSSCWYVGWVWFNGKLTNGEEFNVYYKS